MAKIVIFAPPPKKKKKKHNENQFWTKVIGKALPKLRESNDYEMVMVVFIILVLYD